MAVDLAGTPTAGLDVQPCGGAHLSNSGRPPLPSAAGVRRQRPDRRPTGGPFTSNSRNTATLQDDRRHPLERFEIVGIASIQAGRRRSSTDGASDLEIVDIRQSTAPLSPLEAISHGARALRTLAYSCLRLRTSTSSRPKPCMRLTTLCSAAWSATVPRRIVPTGRNLVPKSGHR